MVKDDAQQLSAAKRAYKQAASVGNCQEEARWANVIGDMLKNRGEYVEALRWFRIDYEISVQHLPEKQILTTCQALGEVYLRLQRFKEALTYQKRHLELAKDANDLVEQQRASTQLGRTYHEMFLKSDDDHSAVRNAKKYFKSAMKLACTLKENTSYNKSTYFLKEFIDAHNNLGMLDMDLDNLEEAQKILLEGLKICDEEEVVEDDDARSRLHHNLGSVYLEMRMWDKARDHIEKDIIICKRIGHCQGEAKGYINLGELHYRVQKYEEALRCYQKALDIAKSMEDEDALVDNINQNIKTMKEAAKVMDDLKKEEQTLKKLTRTITTARGTPHERKYLRQQNASLDSLIEKSSMIFAWLKHLEFSKRKKRVASELCDKEKLSDSFLAIGESYQKLQKFKKALKWYMKSWNIYKSIGNLEGQALAKINIGDVLDSNGDCIGALKAFEEGYRIAVEANLPSVQLSALNNMHYSHMIRFDNVEEARRLQQKIEELESSRNAELEAQNRVKDCCSETETEGDDDLSDNRSNTSNSPEKKESASKRSKLRRNFEQFEDDEPLISILRSNRTSSKPKVSQPEQPRKCNKRTEPIPKGLTKSSETQYPLVSRKRVRLVLTDDESDDEVDMSRGRSRTCQLEDVATSYEFRKTEGSTGFSNEFQDATRLVASKDTFNVCTPINLEESTCSYKSRSPKVVVENGICLKSSCARDADNTSNIAACGSKTNGDHASDNVLHSRNAASYSRHITDDEYSHCITFKVDGDLINIDARTCTSNNKLNIESMKAEVACLYYLQLSEEKRLRGLLPIIRHMKCDGKALEPAAVESLKDISAGKRWIEVDIDGWVQKRFIKSYIDCCRKLLEKPNMKLLKQLYNLEVSEDEVIISECELQDMSITPLLDALREHKTIALLDLSHNMLGNETMEQLQRIFMSSSQKYGGLTLDLHGNRLGPTALFQICECPVLFTRLEVLNISGNRLTDACGSYLSTIIQNCKALYSLNIERCAITSRTIQKVADAIDSGSVLAHLSIGHNNPVTGKAMVDLLGKLGTLKSFSELNVNGIKLSKLVVDGLCKLAKASCLSGLMLGNANIGSDGVLELTKALSSHSQELVKLDLSYCGLMSNSFIRLCADITSIGGILELNLGGNSVGQEGVNALESLLTDPQCSLKVLTLKKCHLRLAGVTRIIQALAENVTVEELDLSENVNTIKENISKSDITPDISTKSIELNLLSDITPDGLEIGQNDLCVVSSDCNHLEVADSEDGPIKGEPNLSSLEDSCTSSCRRNTACPESKQIEELSTAISMVKQLQLLDLSSNGFTFDIAETLYTAWSTSSRAGASSQKHIEEQIVHFSVDGKICCGVKVCCKRDS